MLRRYHSPFKFQSRENGMAYSKRDAIRIVSSAAKEYQKKLEGTNLLFIYRDRKTNQIEFFEAIFWPIIFNIYQELR